MERTGLVPEEAPEAAHPVPKGEMAPALTPEVALGEHLPPQAEKEEEEAGTAPQVAALARHWSCTAWAHCLLTGAARWAVDAELHFL